MPIYQYDCADCERRVDVFFRSANSAGAPVCPECDGTQLTRVMSQFARAYGSGERVDAIDFDREMGRLGSGGEAEFARWARRMGKEHDETLGTNYRELAERTDAGEDPVERVDPGHTLQHKINEQKRKTRRSGQGGAASGD